jgi:hypothetical protein
MSILSVQAAIVSALAAVERSGESVFRSVVSHGGRVDLDTLRRYTTGSPTVLVSCLGGSVMRSGSATHLDAEWAAFLVAQDSVTPRVTTAVGAVDILVQAVADNLWSESSSVAGAPSQVRAQNLYSAGTDARGVALWAVTWTQRVVMDEAPVAYEDLLSVVCGIDDPDTSASPDLDVVIEVSHV